MTSHMTRLNKYLPIAVTGLQICNWADRELVQSCEEGMVSHEQHTEGLGPVEALSGVHWGHSLCSVEITSTHQLGNWNDNNIPMS